MKISVLLLSLSLVFGAVTFNEVYADPFGFTREVKKSSTIKQRYNRKVYYHTLYHIKNFRRPEKRCHLSGKVLVEFEIGKNGQLIFAKLYKSSGSSYVDRTALRIVRSIEKFPKPPKGKRNKFVLPIVLVSSPKKSD